MFKKKKAYMTIEAAMIFPIIFIGIVFVIFIGFYLYDTAAAKQAAYISAVRGSRQKEWSNAEIEEYTRKQLKEQLGDSLLAVREIKTKVQVSFASVQVSVKLRLHMPFFQMISERIGLWEYETTERAVRVNPVRIIRGIRKISKEP